MHQVAHDLGDATAEELAAEVDARWGRLGMPRGWVSDRKRGEARAMAERLAAYFDHARAKGWVKVGAEVEMKVVLGRAEIRGSIDRLERLPDGRLRVVDYKTGSGRPTKAEVPRHPQLGVYQLGVDAGALAEHGSESGGAALLQVGAAANKGVTLDEQPPLREAEDPQWAAELVSRTADGMSGSTFLATTNDLCSMCQVRSCCPAWPEGRVV